MFATWNNKYSNKQVSGNIVKTSGLLESVTLVLNSSLRVASYSIIYTLLKSRTHSLVLTDI